jgi:NitT/TauT family transport system permease protein
MNPVGVGGQPVAMESDGCDPDVIPVGRQWSQMGRIAEMATIDGDTEGTTNTAPNPLPTSVVGRNSEPSSTRVHIGDAESAAPHVASASARHRRTFSFQSPLGKVSAFLATFAMVLGAWEAIKAIGHVPNSRLPHTWAVAAYLGSVTQSGQREYLLLAQNILTTFEEAIVGLIVAILVGGVLGVLSAKVPLFGRSVTPLLVLTQTLPIVAIAPALVIWLGQTWTSKAAIAGLIAFFPIAVSVTRGIRDIPTDQILLMRSFGASRQSLLFKLELPSAMAQANSAIPTAAALAVIGAVVAELSVATGNGIAVVLLGTAQFYDLEPAALWCAAIATALCGIVLVYGARFVFSHVAQVALRTSFLPEVRV